MPQKGAPVSEQRQQFLEDSELNYDSVTEVAERIKLSRTTADTHPGHQSEWINRLKKHGQAGFHELSRRFGKSTNSEECLGSRKEGQSHESHGLSRIWFTRCSYP